MGGGVNPPLLIAVIHSHVLLVLSLYSCACPLPAESDRRLSGALLLSDPLGMKALQ